MKGYRHKAVVEGFLDGRRVQRLGKNGAWFDMDECTFYTNRTYRVWDEFSGRPVYRWAWLDSRGPGYMRGVILTDRYYPASDVRNVEIEEDAKAKALNIIGPVWDTERIEGQWVVSHGAEE